jgi:hypothetical protein
LISIIKRNVYKAFSAAFLDDWREVNEIYQLQESRCTRAAATLTGTVVVAQW